MCHGDASATSAGVRRANRPRSLERRDRAVDVSARRGSTRVSVVAMRRHAAFASCWRFEGGEINRNALSGELMSDSKKLHSRPRAPRAPPALARRAQRARAGLAGGSEGLWCAARPATAERDPHADGARARPGVWRCSTCCQDPPSHGQHARRARGGRAQAARKVVATQGGGIQRKAQIEPLVVRAEAIECAWVTLLGAWGGSVGYQRG